MLKKFIEFVQKEKRTILAGLTVFVLLTGVAGITVKAQDSGASLLEKIAQYAGKGVSENINAKLNASGVLDQPLSLSGDTLSFGGATPDIHFSQSNGYFISSTTPFAVQNPFNATTSVFTLIYNQTGEATTTYTLNCGTSTSAYGTVGAGTLINVTGSASAPTATSGLPTFMSGDTIGSGYGGPSSGANTKTRITVAPTEWIVCTITSPYGTGLDAFTSAASTFAGKYYIEWFNWPK